MPRRPRNHLSDGFFHVTSRGVARCTVFLDDDDRSFLVALLVLVARQFGWRCHAFCLMTNHYHLVVETTREALSFGMHRLNGRYARSFNERYSRVGHLFQNRFEAYAIDSEQHLEAASTYVLENAARAGLCAYGDRWPWAGALVDVSAEATC